LKLPIVQALVFDGFTTFLWCLAVTLFPGSNSSACAIVHNYLLCNSA